MTGPLMFSPIAFSCKSIWAECHEHPACQYHWGTPHWLEVDPPVIFLSPFTFTLEPRMCHFLSGCCESLALALMKRRISL